MKLGEVIPSFIFGFCIMTALINGSWVWFIIGIAALGLLLYNIL